jgi:hypothetical protein
MNLTHLLFFLSSLVMSACSSTQPVIEKPGGAPATGLTGTYRKLCELNGKPVDEAE